MKHLTIALILTLAGLAPYAHAQGEDGRTEAGSADQEACNGTCMSQVSTTPTVAQRSPYHSAQAADDALGSMPKSNGGTDTER